MSTHSYICIRNEIAVRTRKICEDELAELVRYCTEALFMSDSDIDNEVPFRLNTTTHINDGA